ncbi:hypothetical protein K4A83_02540 [Spirulina subsalsa FACHB-351]|uniref:Uncharacterized protein n=1 Tax=Spirulina subsalsa FACHB-351 TaxID=234711 RepID=A0ABT3L0Y9_9CYAN|nr:hypothetical protein [Spirulina subsalsa]MCW6035152.1 hypothetical protein [Spirulina subsalsa FACHB-351]
MIWQRYLLKKTKIPELSVNQQQGKAQDSLSHPERSLLWASCLGNREQGTVYKGYKELEVL